LIEKGLMAKILMQRKTNLPVKDDTFITVIEFLRVVSIHESGVNFLIDNNLLSLILSPWITPDLDPKVYQSRMRTIVLAANSPINVKHRYVNMALSDLVRSSDSRISSTVKESLA
jgi:hypothetical protein